LDARRLDSLDSNVLDAALSWTHDALVKAG